jgi:exonuclease SbcC
MTITHIFHISDIHIMEKNYTNIQSSFAVLVKTIIAQGINTSLLVIAGDIFESKTYLNTDDIYVWKLMCLILKKENIKTIVMPGNHCVNPNSDLVKDNVSLLTIDCNNIKCINQTGIFNCAEFGDPNIEFYIFSVIDKLIPIINNNSCIKIALLHEPVNHAVYDNGESISNGRFSAEDLAQYNYVMLGDIHLTQFLTDRIAYCGSFVQKTKGEGISKGYILWNLTTGIGKFTEIPLKELYIKIEAHDNQCIMPVIKKNQTVRHTSLIYSDCTPEYIESLKQTITNKYTYINRIVDNTKLKKDKNISTDNIIDKGDGYHEGHEKIIKIILKDNANLPKILTHHIDILRNRTENNYTTYKLNYLYFSNVFCYGEDNYINFAEFHNDLVMLNGKNKDGKSSIIDIIIRVLFNECERGFKEDIVNKTKNQGFIKLSFNIGEDEYTIEQVFNRSSKSQQHRLYKNDENISCDTIINTYKFLREKIGLGDYKDFVNMTTALQNRKFLVDMAQKDFISLLTKITNIDILKDVEDETKKQISLLKSINKKIDVEIQNVPNIKNDEISTLKTSIVELEKIRDDALVHINTINTKLSEVNRNYNNIHIPDDLTQQINAVVVQLENFKDFKTNLVLSDVQKKYWNLEKTLCHIPADILAKIMKNNYSSLNSLNRPDLVKNIKSLNESTYKPVMDSIREISVLEAIINMPCLETVGALERCEITALVHLDPSDMNDNLIETGLPNYDLIKQDFTATKNKIEQFNSNFGSLIFNDGCKSCTNNAVNIKKIFDVVAETEKLANLKNIYDQRKINKLKLTAAISYKKNLLQNEIFSSNQDIKASNAIILEKIKHHSMAVNEMREAVNKKDLITLRKLEQQLNLFKEKEIQCAELERQDLVTVKSYLVNLQEYKSLQNLSAIKIANGTSIITINKLKALAIINNDKLNNANKKLSGVLETYRVKQNHYDNRLKLVKTHADNSAELDFNELYFKVVNCKTGIPSYVLKNTCSRVQSNCNKILQKIADFTIFIEYEKEVKIYTIENDIKIPAALSSGYQRFLLDLIFRITLTEISSISCPRILFVDEGFGSLDRDNFIAVANILQKLKLNFDSLIIISHINELKSYVDKTINITRSAYLSNVQHGQLTTQEKTIHLLNMNEIDDTRVSEFKARVKKEKSLTRVALREKDDTCITEYCTANGGIEKVLFVISESTIYCNGCKKEFALKRGFTDKHLAAVTYYKKHNAFITTLI